MLNIPNKKLRELMIDEGVIVAETFDQIAAEATETNQPIVPLLLERNYINESYYMNLLSRYLGVPLASLESREIDPTVLNLLPEDMARQRKIILFAREGDGSFSAAMEDPSDLVSMEYIERFLKGHLKPYLASGRDLSKGFALYSEASATDFQRIVRENIEASMKSKVKGEEAASDLPIVALVDNMLSYAIAVHASDIHIEIFDGFVMVRFRQDGVLKEIFRIPEQVHSAIIARIKILGRLKIDEHAKPQDGRTHYEIGGEQIDIRIAIMPTFHGEKIVMRLLPVSSKPASFTELGMFDDVAKALQANVNKSYGMILVTGPTGSGKTTTLYSVLHQINKPDVNIVTIEDPVEYNMEYVNQSQVNVAAGITFASALRQFLRQDPDVIMVGEIRDKETAEIAVQAALTGHLVLSTLHTNDAPTAIPRFLDLGIQPFLLAATLNIIIAQRLVRHVCPDCIYSRTPSAEELEAVRMQAEKMKLASTFTVPKFVYSGKGCQACGNTGYRGRLGIYEIIEVDEFLRREILKGQFSIDAAYELMRKRGTRTMFEDGILKASQGITTIEEVLRVVGE